MQPDDFLQDDPTDFLDASPAAATWTSALEEVRSEVLDWGAAALRARRPELIELKGGKGLQQMRQDMDLHLRHLLTASPSQAAAAMETYRHWLLAAIWLQRPAAGELATAQGSALAEALVRFAPWPGGLRAAEAVAQGLGADETTAKTIAELLKMR